MCSPIPALFLSAVFSTPLDQSPTLTNPQVSSDTRITLSNQPHQSLIQSSLGGYLFSSSLITLLKTLLNLDSRDGLKPYLREGSLLVITKARY